jgi:uncharacterized membrane protein YdjX (TVP38/TMEM64 family)
MGYKETIIKYSALAVIVTIWIFLILNYAKSLPSLFIPHSFKELKEIITILKTIPADAQKDVFILYCLLSLFKQTFGIPGTAIFNVMGGALYGSFIGVILVCILSAFGCSVAYLLSKHIMGPLFFATCVSQEALNGLKQRALKHKDNQLTFMIILRIIPLIPHWFINVCAPFVGVPIWTFFVSVLIGIIVLIRGYSVFHNLHRSSIHFNESRLIFRSIFILEHY